MAQNLVGVSLVQPSSDPNVGESQTFTLEGSPQLAGGGGINAYALEAQYSTDDSNWSPITTTGQLTTTDTTQITDITDTNNRSWTITAVTAGTYYVRVGGERGTGTQSTWTYPSGSQQVTVTSGAVTADGAGGLSLAVIAATTATAEHRLTVSDTAELAPVEVTTESVVHRLTASGTVTMSDLEVTEASAQAGQGTLYQISEAITLAPIEVTAETVEHRLSASGTVTLDAIEVTTAATWIWPKVWLNTTETKTGANAMTVTDVTATTITFTDPSGGLTGALKLGVEHADGSLAWIDVNVKIYASGTITLDQLTTTNTVDLTHKATGAPSLAAVELTEATITLGGAGVDASGDLSLAAIEVTTASVEHRLTASDNVTLDPITATGSINHTLDASGAVTLDQIEISGTLEHRLPATSSVTADPITASGTILSARIASGAITLDQLTASAIAEHRLLASGSPSIAAIELTEATLVLAGQIDAYGDITLDQITATGSSIVGHSVSSAVDLADLTTTSSVVHKLIASSTINLGQIEVTTADAQVSQGVTASGTIDLADLTASAAAAITRIASGAVDLSGLTVSSSATSIHFASGAITLDNLSVSNASAQVGAQVPITADGVIDLAPLTSSAIINRPKAWLNTTQTLLGALKLQVTAYSDTQITFTDPVGGYTGALYLGVEHARTGNLAWIPVQVSDQVPRASGDVTLAQITSTGYVQSSGAILADSDTSLEELSSSGITNVFFGAPGSPNLTPIWATTDVDRISIASGTIDLAEIEVTVALVQVGVDVIADAEIALSDITASANAFVTRHASGSLSLADLEVTADLAHKVLVSGAVNSPAIELTNASIVLTPEARQYANADVALDELEVLASLKHVLTAQGAVSVEEILASGQTRATLSGSADVDLPQWTVTGFAFITSAPPTVGRSRHMQAFLG